MTPPSATTLALPMTDPTDPAYSVWVAASAGTGKTTVLTSRVLRLMLAGTAPARILGITFTKAAAAEMSVRITGTLERWAAASDEDLRAQLYKLLGERQPNEEQMRRARQLFALVLDAPGGLKILTIHAFCQSLLRRFPLEAGLPPHFEVMDELTAAELVAAACRTVMARAGAAASALSVAASHVGEVAFDDLVRELVAKRGRLEDALHRFGGAAKAAAAARRRLDLAAHETPESVVAAACEDAAFDGRRLKQAAEAMLTSAAGDREHGQGILTWLADRGRRAAAFGDYRLNFLTKDLAPRARLCAKALAARAPHHAEALEAEAQRMLAVTERCRAATIAVATEAMLTLAEAILADYRREKQRRSSLDFDDLILLTRDLLRKPGIAPWVLYKLDGGLDHILVDEAQDTNLDQWAVIEALAAEFFSGHGARAERRTIFAVGDAKQSIFMFQGADPTAFQQMRERFRERVTAAQLDWDVVPLLRSYRSTAAVLEAVDAVFATPDAAQGLGEDGPIRHVAHRAGQAGLVELWPPATRREVDEPSPWEPPLRRLPGDSPRRRLARLIAARIDRMVKAREFLESEGRPIRPGDVMVLVRRRNAFVDDLVRALKQLRVPVAGVDRMLLTEQIAVMDLMALGEFLLLPEDDLTLAVVLRSPLIDLDEDALFALAHGRVGGLWRTLRERAAERPDFGRAHDMLAGLLALADTMPVYELYAHVLGRLGGRAALLRRLGPEAADPVDEFMNLALAFERANAPSLQHFLHWVRAAAVEVKRELDRGDGGGEGQVRIMTVHGAKGLEAPVVFLPDTCEIPSVTARLLWHGEGARHPILPLWVPRKEFDTGVATAARRQQVAAELAEYRRLLYVAMTRPRDRLYICGYKQRDRDGSWHALASSGLAGLGTVFDFDSCVELGEVDGWRGPARRLVCPQTVAPETPKRRPAAASDVAPPPWLKAPPPGEPDPPRPLAPSRPSGEEPPVRSPLGPDDGVRFKRGLLIHRLLQTLPDAPPAQRRALAATFLARRLHGLTQVQQDEMLEETLRVLDMPDYATLFGAGSRAEVPVVGEVRRPDGSVHVIAGQIDRLIVTETAVLILDYKTNRPPPEVPEDVSPVYLRQMAAYRAALQRIYPDRPIRCALLWTDGPRLMPLAESALAAHLP